MTTTPDLVERILNRSMAYAMPLPLLVEAVKQLRGECGERQVAGATTAICHGTGGILSAAATAILSTET